MKLHISIKSLGKIFMFLYILSSYVAKGIIIPTKVNSIMLIAFVAIGIFIIGVSVIQTKKMKISEYSIWYFVFMVISLFMMLYAPEIHVLTGEFYLMIVAFVLTMVVQIFVVDGESFRFLAWSYATASIILIMMLFVTGNLVASAENRLGESLVGNANAFAAMIMVASIYTIWLFMFGCKKRIVKVILVLMFLINCYVLALSAGRSAFIIPFVFLFTILMLKSDNKGRKNILRKAVIILAIVIVIAFLVMKVPMLYQTIGYRFESYILGILGEASFGASAYIRTKMKVLALKEWLNRPLLGHGFDSFKYYARSAIGHFYYSHCNYTELLYNGGLIYFSFYYYYYFRVVKKAIVHSEAKEKYRIFSIAIIVAMLVYDLSIVSYSIASTQILLALASNCLSFENQEENRGIVRYE